MIEMNIASEGETLSDLEFLFSEDETPANEEGTSKGKFIAM
jgi:ubiquitin-conjugating enzyme E2 Q